MRQEAIRLLRDSLNYQSAEFRPGQYEAIESAVVRSERTLVVQRTGWGKSLVYFISTKLLRNRNSGPTLLISPLLALMRNQIQMAERIDIRAETINSVNTEEWQTVRDKLNRNEIDILLVSPERLANQDFLENYLLPVADKIGLFVVDEAHCISDWGHDFRPDYRRIVRILKVLPPNIPVIATTATANDRVVNDVVDQLGKNILVHRGPLARESLRLQNISLPKKADRYAWLAENLPKINGCGIIYVLTKRDADQLAEWLQKQNINVHPYHSDIEKDSEHKKGLKNELEQKLLNNEIKALVATTAIGMGFDKPDLGFVIHYQRPGSVVAYYQQVGRAGRALDSAYGILFQGEEDNEILEYFIKTAFPPAEQIEEVLNVLRKSSKGLTKSELLGAVNLRQAQIDKILKFLAAESPSPVSKNDNAWIYNPVNYQLDTQRISKVTNFKLEEQRRIQEYMNTSDCLMAFLSRELSDPFVENCGKCMNCAGKPLPDKVTNTAYLEKALEFINNYKIVIEPRKQWQRGALPTHRFTGNIAPNMINKEGRSLCYWGDPLFGELVRNGKFHDGKFDDRLLDKSSEIIRDRWKPNPFPTWCTFVPSRKHPELVSDFAKRLSKILKIEFIPCIEKTRDTRPQKEMVNSFRQARNLDGAFAVINNLIKKDEPVLLIDDMVDSRWTFTIIGALLKQAGSGAVFPFALADSSGSE